MPNLISAPGGGRNVLAMTLFAAAVVFILGLAVHAPPPCTAAPIQEQDSTRADSLQPEAAQPADSLSADTTAPFIDPEIPQRDSLSIVDTLSTQRRRSGIDTVVNFEAQKRVTYSVRNRKLQLVGDAKVTYSKQALTADTISIFMRDAMMQAFSGRDSLGRLYGIPHFTDDGETFHGERLSYNFETKKGAISMGETVIADGYYYGEKIKRVSEEVLYVKDGAYTTCDDPHPHFYFASPKMKIVANNRIFVDPLIVYVEDLPVFIVPFGVFIENKRGRRSGILIPSFFFSGAPGGLNRGIVFEDFGYYWAVSDYFDTEFTTDISTKGGYELKNYSRYKVGSTLDGNFRLNFGRTRANQDAEITTFWRFEATHAQNIDPQLRITSNLDFSSRDFNRQSSTNISERVQSRIRSSASIVKRFDNGSSLSIGYSRDQDLIVGGSNETLPRVSYTIPQIFPFESLVDDDSWLAKISFNYGVNGIRTIDTPPDTATLGKTEISSSVRHTPALRISTNLDPFSITPSISYSESWFFRKLNRQYNAADSSTFDEFEHGFFREYNFSMGVDVGTRLYGLAYPNVFGITAFRHTVSPTVGFRYSPDFSDPSFGFFGSYFDPIRNENVEYAHYRADGGGSAGREQKLLTYSVLNTFEIKVAQADTSEDKRVELFKFNFNGSYDFARDSLRFSNVSTRFSTQVVGLFNMSANASFSLYDLAENRDEETGAIINYTEIDEFYINAGKGLARLENASININASFSSEGVRPSETEEIHTEDPIDSVVDYGLRFQQREAGRQGPGDTYGDNSPGYSPFSMPWNANLGLSFSYSESTPQFISRRISLNAALGLRFTPTWNVRTSFNYDFVENTLIVPTISLSKDLHAWELALNWQPGTGGSSSSSGFYLRFGIKSPQLRNDLQLEKRGGINSQF